MEIFIIQKMTIGRSNCHYENYKSFTSLGKAVRHCVTVIGLKPTNYKNKEQFIKEDFQLFINDSRHGASPERYRIMKMVVER